MARDSKDKAGPNEQQLIRDLAALLDETGLTEIEIEKSGLKVRVARSVQIAAAAQVHTPLANPGMSAAGPGPVSVPLDPAAHPGAVKSPMVGTAYRSAEPASLPFIEVGARVKEGQTLLIIEAMKTMNHIPAPSAGTVTEILFENGQPVEFGEVLIILE
ncbi:MAG TPA: acetyl-CoA carboxylase biotin carboxyl carrier protein [Hyphomicrobiaceae bacterium]|nr:acetyl-CoA carboxylase biotin carboxyl carrier protein [Hyphomicrobiaceae bacterium]